MESFATIMHITLGIMIGFIIMSVVNRAWEYRLKKKVRKETATVVWAFDEVFVIMTVDFYLKTMKSIRESNEKMIEVIESARRLERDIEVKRPDSSNG